jgi:hypothetical protein
MTQLDCFDVLTPLGPAFCIGIVDDTDAVEWVTFIKSTGEPWFWKNPQIRMLFDATSGLGDPSPFVDLSEKVKRHIERYKKNGWL